ncbi:alpha/beta fold hydrolase [bacterium]|nr:alpha/beta fold hydrolase [bacterium]
MTVQPDWLDKQAYPFASQTLDLDAGRIHYADEGTGETILMVHGTPMWSFLYRHLIRDLRDDYRVIALDKPGFGLSDRRRLRLHTCGTGRHARCIYPGARPARHHARRA